MVVPFVNWHTGSEPAEIVMAVGVPTVGVIFTVLTTCVEGPPHPLAVTWISTVPKKPFDQLISPVEAFMEPAAISLTDQLNPVLLVAVVA